MLDTTMRTQRLNLSTTEANAIATSLRQKNHIASELARKYVEDGHQHETLMEAAQNAADLCKGIDTPAEIKKLFRQEVRSLQRAGRGGY